MKLLDKRVMLTGAAGGIGSALSQELLAQGAKLILVDREKGALQILRDALQADDTQVTCVALNLLDSDERVATVDRLIRTTGGIDILINAAGMMSYRPFAQEDTQLVERLIQLNTVVPMLLSRQLLPHMLTKGSGLIVNLGSIFGSIAFAWFASYSASKYALRGFSEALRRELHGTGVDVSYIAPRAVRTGLNTEAVYRMADATGMQMDNPDWVAKQIVRAIAGERKEVYLGFPESLFVRINALLPRLVDLALRGRNRKMLEFAQGETP